MIARPLLLALIVVSVALNAAAQLFLRLGAKAAFDGPGQALPQMVLAVAFRPAIIAGLACYAFSLLAWVYVLSKAEASFAYPFLGLGFVIVALAGWLFLGETPTALRLAAMAVIAVGIAMLAWS